MAITHRSAAKDLSAGVYSALSTSAFTALSPVFRGYVPQNTTCPYSVVQSVTENPGWETMGQPAKDCTFQLHVVSQSRGEAEAADILTAGVGILLRGYLGSTAAAVLTVANHTVCLVEYEGSDGYEDDQDETGVLSFHRVGRFRVQLEQST